MIKKLFAALLSLSIMASSFAVFADGDVALNYDFTTANAGVADGTVTISNIPANTTAVRLYWADATGTKLATYNAIKEYTQWDSNYAYNRLATDITYEIAGSRLVPEGAKSLIAEITNAGGTTVKKVDIPATNQFPAGEERYSMIWVSDVHASYTSYQESSNQSVAFAKMKKIADGVGSKFKGVVANGDLANVGAEYEYAFLEEIYEKNNITFPIYYNTGNHDTAMYGFDNCYNAVKVRWDKLKAQGINIERTDKWSYDTYIDGDHYIFLSLPYEGAYGLSAAQVEWLETKISEDEKSGEPTFVFSHMPARETVPGSYAGDGKVDLKEIIERHPSAILITSHLHSELDSDMKTVVVGNNSPSYVETATLLSTNIWADKTAAELGAATGSSTKTNDGADLGINTSNPQGRYVEVYDDKVVIKSINFATGNNIPRAEYIIPLSANKFEGTPSVSFANLNAGTTLTAQLNGDAVPAGYTCEWYVDGAKVSTDDTYAVMTANKNVALKVIAGDGAYAWASTNVFSYTEPTAPTEPPSAETPDEDTPPVINGSDVAKFYGEIVRISGRVDASYAGEKVMLVIAPKTSYSNPSTIKYIDECTVAADGTYSLKVAANAVSANDFLMTKLQGQNVTNSVVSLKGDNEHAVQLTASLNAENKPSLNISNMYLGERDVTVLIATYDNEQRFIGVKPVRLPLGFAAYNEVQSYVDEAAVEGHTCKVMVWDSILSPTAFGNVVELAIPSLATE